MTPWSSSGRHPIRSVCWLRAFRRATSEVATCCAVDTLLRLVGQSARRRMTRLECVEKYVYYGLWWHLCGARAFIWDEKKLSLSMKRWLMMICRKARWLATKWEQVNLFSLGRFHWLNWYIIEEEVWELTCLRMRYCNICLKRSTHLLYW